MQLHLEVDQEDVLEAAVAKLGGMAALRVLTVTVAAGAVPRRTMAAVGALRLREVRVVRAAAAAWRHSGLARRCGSHLDDGAVKAYVDAVCCWCVAVSTHGLQHSVVGPDHAQHTCDHSVASIGQHS